MEFLRSLNYEVVWTLLLLSFIVGFATDYVWTRCVHYVQKHNAFRAANWSIGIYICGVVSTLIIVDKNVFAVLAYLIGCYCGTYLGVRLHVDKQSLTEIVTHDVEGKKQGRQSVL